MKRKDNKRRRLQFFIFYQLLRVACDPNYLIIYITDYRIRGFQLFNGILHSILNPHHKEIAPFPNRQIIALSILPSQHAVLSILQKISETFSFGGRGLIRIQQTSFKIKNNMKNKNQNKKGFGFADAFFGMKDLQCDYDAMNVGQKTQEEKKPDPPIKPVVNKTNVQPAKKAVVVKKEPIKQNLSMQPKTNTNTFTINPGKEHNSLQLLPLKKCRSQQHITELTVNGKLSRWEFNVFCDGVPSSLLVENPIVGFNFEPTDIFQGNLGNCYFISSLASLGHLPKVLRERIPFFKMYDGSQKLYKVNLFESGKSVQMQVDNLFPKVYSSPVGNDIAPMVLEKAYAQLYGNYEILKVGFSSDSLRDLTGAPSEFIELKDKMKVKNEIQKAFAEKYPMVIDSKASVESQYISPRHSFIVLDYKIKSNDIFLKIRDPRGRKFTNMPMPLATKNQITEEDKENGIFWTDFYTLSANFKVIAFSKVKYGYQYFYKTFAQNQLNNNQAAVLLTVKENAEIHFSCHQKHKKFFDEKYYYQILRLLVGRVEVVDGKIQPKQLQSSNFNCQQACSVSCKLKPGSYLMMGGIGNGQKLKDPSQAITFSIYSSTENIDFMLVQNYFDAGPFLKQYIENNKEQFKKSMSDQRLYRYFGPLYGYLCLYYHNESKKEVVEEMDYTVENILIKEKKVSIKYGQKKLIMHPIGEKNNCSHKFAFKTKTFYK